ncbi:MAG: S-methyl-5-thioribose kinase [Oscillospiraceae bacterium]|nr:S-methyl-5-thioribose kinase [Oscillospiraceae bacterium]
MAKFDEFFLMNTEDVKDYAVKRLQYFSAEEKIDCTEIGDGNINYVFRVFSLVDGHSVVIKQADKFLRSSGRPLDTYRNKIEANILRIQGELAPGFVPKVYYYDDIMCAVAMEDISDYKNLRKELAAGKIFPQLAQQLSDFIAAVLLPSTDLIMDRAEKKKNSAFFTNTELCDITEDLVLTEPYYNYKNRNIIFPGNEDFVRTHLYEDEELHFYVAKLRNKFMNNTQALIHGDLHTGSIFANKYGIKVIDPEFAFYGPMGYDIGNVIGNLFFAYINKLYTEPDNTAFLDYISKAISDYYDLTFSKLSEKYDELVSFPLYKNSLFKEEYLREVMADSLGYAGTEMIRRTVGDSKVFEVSSILDPDIRINIERRLITLGIELIKRAESIKSGSALLELV